MNAEDTVLQFFSQEENLDLALFAAEHLDTLRLQHNNRFWETLRAELDSLLTQHALPWHSALTEDRNSEGCLVGLHLEPAAGQRTFLRPFMEQQLLGESYRIYYGLIWNTAPEPAQKAQPAVAALQQALAQDGFKQGDNFLAWQWSPWYPRRREFLLRFSAQREELLAQALQPWQALLLGYGTLLQAANHALRDVAPSVTVSLEQLRSKIQS